MDTIFEDDEDEFNMDDYEQVEDESLTNTYIDCLNIGQLYFKSLFQKNKESMLEGTTVKDEYSTNRSMEFMYEIMYKYNTNIANNSKLCDIYEPDQIQKYLKAEEHEELFGLSLNNKLVKVSPSLFAIITYISHKVNWKHETWFIIPLKTES